MHILTGLHDARVTPANVLYDEWKRALEAWNGPLNAGMTQTGIQWGVTPNHGIGVVDNVDNADNDRMALGFGYVSGRHVYPWMVIAANGEFRLNFKLWGWQQRNTLAQNTFLTWNHTVREYTWRISDEGGSYSDPDWRKPVHYVGERTLGMYGRGSVWLRPKYNGTEWEITFSRPSIERSQHHNYTVDQSDFDRFDALRARRYRQWERDHLIYTGVIKPNAPRTRLTPEEQQQRFDRTAASLSGFMAVTTQPTRLTKKESV